MSLTLRKTVLVNGNRVDYPKLGDEVEVDYIGWLYEAGDLVVDHRGRESVAPSLIKVFGS